MRSCAPVVAKASISGTCAVRARHVSSVRSIRSVRVVRVSVGKRIFAATVPLGDPSNGDGAHGKTTGNGLSTQTVYCGHPLIMFPAHRAVVSIPRSYFLHDL
jgi:hypothetical protein